MRFYLGYRVQVFLAAVWLTLASLVLGVKHNLNAGLLALGLGFLHALMVYWQFRKGRGANQKIKMIVTQSIVRLPDGEN
jgi:hypothetical protein